MEGTLTDSSRSVCGSSARMVIGKCSSTWVVSADRSRSISSRTICTRSSVKILPRAVKDLPLVALLQVELGVELALHQSRAAMPGEVSEVIHLDPAGIQDHDVFRTQAGHGKLHQALDAVDFRAILEDVGARAGG